MIPAGFSPKGDAYLGLDFRLNKARAVENFAAGFRKMASLPFATDADIAAAYGAEVAEALKRLEANGRERNICRDCSQRCCELVRCEFYSPAFNLCPVQDYRPPLCRLHFCGRYGENQAALVKDLGDVFLDGLQAAARIDAARADLFDCPAFAPMVPDLVKTISGYMTAVRQYVIVEDAGRILIRKEIGKYACAIP